MKKILLIGLFLIPYFLYSQEQVPETFTDGKSTHNVLGTLEIEFPYNNYIYNHKSTNIWGLGVNIFGNVGRFAFGMNFTNSRQIEGENEKKKMVNEISNMKAFKVSIETYFIPIRGTIIQPKLGLAGGLNSLKFSYNKMKEDQSITIEDCSGRELFLSAIGRLDVFITYWISLYLWKRRV